MSSTNTLARIALRGDFPRELIRLLSSLRLDPFGVGLLDADMVAAFAGQKSGGWMLHVRQGPGVASAEGGILCNNAYTAASLLLSRTLRMERPFIVASEPTYAIVREAIRLAANSANVLIEGETGTGKRSLADLINRASGNAAPITRLDCAVSADVEGLMETGRFSSGGTILLDHLAELPSDRQEPLAILMRCSQSRFIATSRFAAKRMVERGTLAPMLIRQFDLTLAIPPINRRRTDLDVLARHFLREANPLLELDSSALMAIVHYRFAGNVRELENMMLRIAICESDGSPRVLDRARIENHFANLPPPAGSQRNDRETPTDPTGSTLRLAATGQRRCRGTDSINRARLKVLQGRI